MYAKKKKKNHRCRHASALCSSQHDSSEIRNGLICIPRVPAATLFTDATDALKGTSRPYATCSPPPITVSKDPADRMRWNQVQRKGEAKKKTSKRHCGKITGTGVYLGVYLFFLLSFDMTMEYRVPACDKCFASSARRQASFLLRAAGINPVEGGQTC